MFDEQGHEIAPPLDVAIASASHGSRHAPVCGIRFPGLRIAPVRENADPARTQATGSFSSFNQTINQPKEFDPASKPRRYRPQFSAPRSLPPNRISAEAILAQISVLTQPEHDRKILLGANDEVLPTT
jgi:hypothetical protein